MYAPYSEATDYFTSSYSYMSNYNGMFKNKDNNYNEDWNQLDEIGARGNVDYWLSCRSVFPSPPLLSSILTLGFRRKTGRNPLLYSLSSAKAP